MPSASAVPTLAHLTGSELPVPTWLLAYGTAFAVVLAFLLLRSSWARPRLRTAATGRDLPGLVQTVARPAGVVLRALGVAAFLLVLAAGLFGLDSDASNLAPYATHITFWLGLAMAVALAGELWRALNPLPALARVVYGGGLVEETDHPAPGLWPAVAVVGVYLWVLLAYHAPYSPRVVAGWLLGVTAFALIGVARWGRRWLLDDEGFAALYGLFGRIGPVFRRADTGRLAVRWPGSGLGSVPAKHGADVLVLVVAGAVAFDGINNTNWWLLDVMGFRTGWSRTLVATAGLAFFVLVGAIAWFAAVRISGRLTGTDHRDVADAVQPVLVPIAVSYIVAHYIGVLVFETANVVALLSDPFGKGWDAIGTIHWTPNFGLLSTRAIAWIGTVAIAVGHLGAVVVAHDRALELHRAPVKAARASTPFVALIAASAVLGVLIVAGG